MRSRPARLAVILLLVPALLLQSCVAVLHREVTPPLRAGTVDGRSPWLKAHLADGRVYLLERWALNSGQDSSGVERLRRHWFDTSSIVSGPGAPQGAPVAPLTLIGSGRLLDSDRALVREGAFSVPLDSVALLETNVEAGQMPTALKAVLIVVGGMAVALAVVCTLDPKACFGSCPTFYASDGRRLLLQAEGFSASVAPALEATDLDALYRARPAGRRFELEMRNEALETQAVRFARVLAAPRPEGGRVFAGGDGRFWQALEILPPRHALAPEGECAAALREFDEVERASAADSTDLAARETLDLDFGEVGGDSLGLVIACRQSLLTTFLFYQTLAWMGRHAGDWLAALGRGDATVRARSGAIGRELGGIEVLVGRDDGGWARAGEVSDTGPLATDVHLVRLPRLEAARPRLRLRMTRGHWRLDQVALVRLGREVEPVRLEPVEVRRGDAPDAEALAALRDPARLLATIRGERFTLVYRLPDDPSRCELFLESRGYYLEWMRREWLAEEDPAKAARAFLDPRGTLRALAPEFHRREAGMETVFWSSRYAQP